MLYVGQACGPVNRCVFSSDAEDSSLAQCVAIEGVENAPPAPIRAGTRGFSLATLTTSDYSTIISSRDEATVMLVIHRFFFYSRWFRTQLKILENILFFLVSRLRKV